MRWKALVWTILLGFLAACSQATSLSPPSPTPSPRSALTSEEKAQLATLEGRPLQIPARPASTCPEGPFTPSITPYLNGRQETNVFGLGPVYGKGGPETRTDKNDYYDVTYLADSSVKGVILVRIQELGGAFNGFFVGPYHAGKAVGTDTIEGVATTLYDELALPVASPSANTSAGSGWAIFKVRQGIDKRYTCVGVQIDSASGTEVVVAAH